MIASGVVVYVSCQPVDFRKGAASLMALVRDGGLDPFNGSLYVFRSKRAQRPTFCIRFSFRDDRLSMASPVWEQGAGFAVSARQEPDVHLYGQAARSIP
ncbi:IS66 family insertion sequence element accessory protein TnpB [Ensifer adhaerens]|uniref:IS66 family insertion sequence element accessory protein TnpB n=1 Tax=Ensifer adhaerens TaxID=106592 RepID=UPI003B84977D